MGVIPDFSANKGKVLYTSVLCISYLVLKGVENGKMVNC